jgi:hypothetical protein
VDGNLVVLRQATDGADLPVGTHDLVRGRHPPVRPLPLDCHNVAGG